MKNDDYCDHCHGDGYHRTNNKLAKCDECAGTGYQGGDYKTIPKENVFGFWQVVQFVAAVLVLIVVLPIALIDNLRR